jgi:kelch-like protein 20
MFKQQQQQQQQQLLSSSTIMDVIRDCDSPTRINKLSRVSERHPKLILDQIQQLRRNNELCDVLITCGNLKINAHKIILSSSSPYFRAMFTCELVESKQTEIRINDLDELAMEMLIDFCYTSKITVDEKNVQNLLPAACLLQLQEVQDVCCEFLRQQLDPSNCLGIRAFADTHSCIELLKIADKYTQNNFAQVMDTEEFLLLPVNQLMDIISCDELNVRNEEQVFESVMKWINYNLKERKKYLSQVLEHVRLPLLSAKYLVTQVSNDPLIKQDQLCRDLIDEAKNYLLLPQERSQMQGPRMKSRKPVRFGQVLFAIGYY